MNSGQDMELARQMAYDWACVELPKQRLAYTDYIKTITGLNTINGNPDRTAAIFSSVIDQAKTLGRSSKWVQKEIKFEAQAEAVGDREEWLLAALEHVGASDATLDQYNERKDRFTIKS